MHRIEPKGRDHERLFSATSPLRKYADYDTLYRELGSQDIRRELF
jgi:hypothetical protein